MCSVFNLYNKGVKKSNNFPLKNRGVRMEGLSLMADAPSTLLAG